MAGGFEQPERGERPGDGADSVHQAFEPEGAGRRRSAERRRRAGLSSRRADSAAKPGGGAADEHMIGVRREGETTLSPEP